MAMGKRHKQALLLCEESEVELNEDLVEKMTPDKADLDQEARVDLLSRLGKLCKKQGLFQLACKKFTQAGDKLRAVKALVKSGDTEKVVFFATTARQPEIYVIAANYLQVQYSN